MSFKERSHTTYHSIHLPELAYVPSKVPEFTKDSQTSHQVPVPPPVSHNIKTLTPIETVLIGDSMLERLKTTGASTALAQHPGSFNAGCGGDKIENVLYRLSFMTPHLERCAIKLWVVMVGTNNLRKKGLRPSDVPLYRLLLQALLRMAPGSKILACEVFQRKDIEDRYVDEANRMIREMVQEMNTNVGEERIFWSEAPIQVTKDHLEDHVHLDQEGYRIWDETLHPKILKLLESQKDM
ncbi:hypothetical protein BGZ51_006080 [Haplosporangium sp. Z 767]|nr:hypothetical protein BGZ51_006080 [Haplosporangium sp. Z 767]